MPRNGAGAFSLVSGNPVVTGTVISSTTMNTTLSDIATALTASIANDGQTVPVANIPMGGFKLTGLGDATVANDAVRFNGAAGTPTSLTLTNATGLPAAGVTGTALTLAGGNLTGGINSARGNITQHATTMDFFAVTSPDILDGTGSAVTITACVNAPQAGATRKFYPIVATVLTHGATFDIAGNANLTAAAGDCWIIEAKTASTYRVTAVKEDGLAVTPGIPVGTSTTTLVLADAGKHQYYTATAGVTIPTNASVAFPIGTAISFVMNHATQALTFTTTSLTVYKAGTATAWASGGTLSVRGMCTFLKVDTDTWYVSGSGLS